MNSAGSGRTRRFAGLACCALLAVTGFSSTAAGVAKDPRLSQVRTWALAIGDGALQGDPATRYANFDLVVLDGEGVRPSQVDALHATGALVLGYLDVGSIERGRGWFGRARRYRLDFWPDWGEWYANTSAPGYRSLLAAQVAPAMLRKGLDGLFLDNLDMIETHPHQTRGMQDLVERLAKLVHRDGKFLFAQNGEHALGSMFAELDGWNREDLGSTYNFDTRRYERTPASETSSVQRALRRIAGLGLLTTATTYTDGSPEQTADAVHLACAAGALPFVSDIGLTRSGPPRRCPEAPS